jgi:DNA-binding CsgD family transcriptional regulator
MTTPKPEDMLMPREFEAVALLAQGLARPEIAARMGIADNTVTHHLMRVKIKTGKETQVAMALWFIEKFPTEADRKRGFRQTVRRLVEVKIKASRIGNVLDHLG